MNLSPVLAAALRNTVSRPARLMAKRIIHAGQARQCVVCGSKVRQFLTQGYGHPVLEELEVVGGMRKEDDECPICHSNDRVRLIHLYITHHSDMLQRPSKLLHVAPEPGLADLWANRPGLDYLAADLDQRRYRHLSRFQACDLQAMPFADGTFDWVICNHVLEHIPDDRRAMREIRRVLKPGGTALLQVPIAMKRNVTDEDPAITDADERIRRFGQADHVRMYGLDYYVRLAEAGLEVQLWSAHQADPVRAKALNLNPRERLTVARRPGPNAN